jgi:hypothetical protein
MPAIHELFKRLAELLPAAEVRRLEAQYRRDKAADERASRQRKRARLAQLKLARAARQLEPPPEEDAP